MQTGCTRQIKNNSNAKVAILIVMAQAYLAALP